MVKPEDVGLSAKRLDRIRVYFEPYIDAGKVAGTLTLVARRGHVVYFEPQGYLELEHKRPMQRDTIFRIYSMSKPITSAALMMLYEQGLVQLDDPVHQFIPAWDDLQVFVRGHYPTFVTAPSERAMSIHDLLTHMSGLTYGSMERTHVDAAYRQLGVGDKTKRGYTLKDMVETLAELPLEFSPGTRWNYSVSTDVVGYLVEVLSGQRFDRYLHDHIFMPLGMHNTSFTVADEQLVRFACNYQQLSDGRLQLIDGQDRSEYGERTLFSGAGGLVSNAEDYFRFASMLQNGGALDGVRLLSRKTTQLMTMNHLPGGQDLTHLDQSGQFTETAFSGVGFGLGFAVLLDPTRTQLPGTPGAYGWGGAASTTFWIDPQEDLIIIFMTQLRPSSAYPWSRALRTLTYAALLD
jgi:CubicO group peptidase (beta-lactamase class C family)